MASLGHTPVILGLCSLFTVTRGLVLGRPIIRAPHVFLEGDFTTFSCIVPDAPKTEAILYELYQEHEPKALGEYTGHVGNAAEFTLRVKLNYEGNFFCKASVQNDSTVAATVSELHYLQVIEPVEGAVIVSDPPLAEIFDGHDLTLTCTVRKGTHVSYQWSHNGGPTGTPRQRASGNSLYVTQTAAEDAGNYFCLARNQLNDSVIYSDTAQIFISVKAVPVSKPKILLTARKENDVHLISMTCRSDKGTPPVNFTFTLLNKTGMWQVSHLRESLSASLPEPIALNRTEGQVWCQAANDGGVAESDTLALEEALDRVSVGTFAIVLSGFLLLVCLLAVCCAYGVIYRRRLSPMKPRPSYIPTETDSSESEDDQLAETDYMEDMDLVTAANIGYPEQGEEESVDEWPEIDRALQISSRMDEAVASI